MAASDRGNLRHSMAFKVRGVRFFILTSSVATWVWMTPYSKSKKLEILFKQIFRLSSVFLIFFRVGCQRNLNLSELSELVRTIRTCQNYPNVLELSERVKIIERVGIIRTCQHHPNVSASSERVIIIRMWQAC